MKIAITFTEISPFEVEALLRAASGFGAVVQPLVTQEEHLAQDKPHPEDGPELPAPRVSRRKPNALGEEEAPSAPANPPVPTSHRRKSEDAPAASGASPSLLKPDAGIAPSIPPATASRRRVAPTDAAQAVQNNASASPIAAASDGSEISDADLSKAASAAARSLTPKGVMDFLVELGVKTTGELKGQLRRDFINVLKARVAIAGGARPL